MAATKSDRSWPDRADETIHGETEAAGSLACGTVWTALAALSWAPPILLARLLAPTVGSGGAALLVASTLGATLVVVARRALQDAPELDDTGWTAATG